MKHTLALFALSLSCVGFVQAGPTGYPSARTFTGAHCAESKFQSRYDQVLRYRHSEDRRRYNARPCPGEVIALQPYVVKTIVVRKAMVPYYYTDSYGNRHCEKALTIVYKDIYSDGSCYVYTTRG